MGDFKYSVNVSNSVGPVSPADFPNSSKSPIFCTTPSVTDPVVSQHSAMQDDLLIEKANVKNQQPVSPSIKVNGEKNAKPKDEDVSIKASTNNVGLNGKPNDQLQSLSTVSTPLHIPQAFVPDASVSAVSSGNVWPTALDDGMMHGMPPHGVTVNGSIAYQNYQSNNPYSPMPGLVQGQGQSAQQRRAITAQHNFPGNVGRSMQGGPNMYMNKGYPPAWSGSQAGWSPGPQQGNMPGMTPWSRGRSVPNMSPVQAMGGYGNMARKPPPTYNQPMVVQSPIKFRRSTSFPGKSIFPQQPTFEITSMEENRDVMMYQASFLC